MPPKCHYKPLLRAVMVKRMLGSPLAAEISIAESGEVDWNVYEFVDKSPEGFWTSIRCNMKGTKVPVPEDYAIKVGGTTGPLCRA